MLWNVQMEEIRKDPDHELRSDAWIIASKHALADSYRPPPVGLMLTMIICGSIA